MTVFQYPAKVLQLAAITDEIAACDMITCKWRLAVTDDLQVTIRVGKNVQYSEDDGSEYWCRWNQVSCLVKETTTRERSMVNKY